MSKTKFSPALFEQLGGMHWSTRPEGAGFISHSKIDSVSSMESESVSEPSVELPRYDIESEQNTLSVNEGPVSSSAYAHESNDPNEANEANELSEASAQASLDDFEKEDVAETQQTIPASTPQKSSIVVLGADLDAVWQNEDNQAWQLWQNIMLAFGWDESETVFFDTANLVSDEMIFSTMEEIIELGVDWVLSMDEEHIISEQLQEGVHVVNVPDLESMLSDPYSKQTFYHSVIAITANL